MLLLWFNCTKARISGFSCHCSQGSTLCRSVSSGPRTGEKTQTHLDGPSRKQVLRVWLQPALNRVTTKRERKDWEHRDGCLLSSVTSVAPKIAVNIEVVTTKQLFPVWVQGYVSIGTCHIFTSWSLCHRILWWYSKTSYLIYVIESLWLILWPCNWHLKLKFPFPQRQVKSLVEYPGQYFSTACQGHI